MNDTDKFREEFNIGAKAYNTGDYKTAFKKFEHLAEKGLAPAQNNLAQMYRYGQGVTQNYKEALKWYRLAAEQGNASAQNSLGVMYENGAGVTKD